MSQFFRILFIILSIGVMLALHHIFRYSTTSLFLAPAGIATLLATIVPVPVTLYILLTIFFELFSSLPLGTMVLVCIIPILLPFFTKSIAPEFSWKFYLFILLIIVLQITSMLVITNVFIPFAWTNIPLTQSILQLVTTSIGTYALAIALHEYIS